MKKLRKSNQTKVAKAEIRYGGNLHGPEKPGWSVCMAWTCNLERKNVQ